MARKDYEASLKSSNISFQCVEGGGGKIGFADFVSEAICPRKVGKFCLEVNEKNCGNAE